MRNPQSDKLWWNITLDIVFDIVGCSLFAVGTQCFSAPNNIAPGGVSGVSILVNYVTGWPISLLSLVINLPLLLLAFLFLGRRFTLRTLKSVLILTVALEVAGRVVPVYQGEMILAALYAGVLSGIGLALVFMRSSTTGGTDIVARLIQKRFPTVSVGRLLLLVDGLVLVSAAFVYRNVESALYALITIFTSSQLIDSILYGLDAGKVLMIVTERYEDIAKAIGAEVGRGCTLLQARGAYTKQDRPMVLVAVRKSQTIEVKRLVFRYDPEAFIMAMEAGEVIGHGFKDSKKAT